MITRAVAVVASLVAGVVVLGIVFFLVAAKMYRMPTGSMEPTLHCARPRPACESKHSDHFLVLRFGGYGRGDLVAFHVPPRAAETCGASGVYVKRVVGLPGDTVEERSGVVYVNDVRLHDSYVEAENRDLQSHPKQRLGADRLYVLGDNRSRSCDSRVWGPLARGEVIGKVFAVYWPPNRIRLM